MKKAKAGKKKVKEISNRQPRISPVHKPKGMTNTEWQIALRKQIAADESFHVQQLSGNCVFGDYKVKSAKSPVMYKVALRSADNSLNFCSCPDFKTNQLGTCKHIEAVMLKLKSRPGQNKQLVIPYNPSYSSVYLDYRGHRKVRLRVGSENEDNFRKLARGVFDEDMTLLESAFLNFDKFLQAAYRIHPQFRCYPDAMEFILQQREKEQRHKLVAARQSELLNGISKTRLFPYQQRGVLFAVKAGRCILADDMGLGKTLQSIICTEIFRKHFKISTALIVCPTSLKYQWKTEIEKFTGNKNVCVVEGNILERKRLYHQNTFDYLIVSYQMAANDAQYLNDLGADMLILDEAQRIKNWKTKTSGAIKRIKTTYALVLTGTPVENKIEDLYSLMQIVNPFILGSLHHFLSKHQVKETGSEKVIGYKDLNEIGKQLSEVMLRRTRKEVLKDLPGRMDKNLFVPMTKEQLELHKEYADVVARLVNKWRRMKFLSEEDRQRLLLHLNMMRMVCDSTYILDQETNFQTKLDELQNILEDIINLPEEKVVVFSQWERMTRLVAHMLEERKIGYEYLHGGVPAKKRGAIYENFANDPYCRVFLSTDAGGVGLNLQSASYMVNLDIPWNPAVLEQRIGRIYRLGQKKNVSIINLVSQETIEHKMLEVIKFKKGIASGILDNGDSHIFLKEDRFNEFMKSVESITTGFEKNVPFNNLEEERETEKQLAVTRSGEIVEVVPEDNEINDPVSNNEHHAEVKKEMPNAEDDFLQKGTAFLSQLVNILNTPEGTERLVKKITETDRETGQTYIKLPVKNQGMIENALKLLGGLFGNAGKG